MTGYHSADHLIETYLRLWAVLGSARALVWPDPRQPRLEITTTPEHALHRRQLVELADIGTALHQARLTAMERRLLREMYRPRKRVCRRCGYVTASPGPRCRRCRAGRADGWTHEPLPTLSVIAEAMSRQTRERWSTERVRRLRDRAYGRLEAVMRRRQMGGEDGG